MQSTWEEFVIDYLNGVECLAIPALEQYGAKYLEFTFMAFKFGVLTPDF